ncbi:SusC/RagA family TonB-linked outer membrane protein [Mucilaginibacter sp.]|uniref:SusC/RagA family TonB-linked outer membrane protein n=1 Tax=Mucilaginibacter sp. TaxID=1882438 RepID=UPI003D10717F
MISSLVVTAQTKHTGKVIGSDDKLPVVGASIKIKGTNTGAVTDVNGDFSLTLSTGNVLVVSYIGYQSKEVTVQGDGPISISLTPVNNSLNEVVVTGYQTQRRKDISGSVVSVDMSAAKVTPVTSAESLLQGQAAGVNVVTQGSPGSAAQVTVRGISTTGNSAPLYVIDGIQEGGMQNVNPNDIESITVLKDAGSTAIYGVGGGNGVIVVTTKKGKNGKTKFTYDGYYGSTSPKSGNVWNVLNAPNYEALVKQVDPQNALLVNGQFQDYGFQSATVKGVGPGSDPRAAASNYFIDPLNPGNDYLIQKFDNAVGTDWFHAIFKTAPQQQHTLTASGANDKNSYYFSSSYTDQRGTLVDTYFKRLQARLNTTFSLNDHIRMGENMQVYYTLEPNGPQSSGGIPGGNQNEGNAISMSYRMQPQIPVYDIKGNYGGTYDGPTQLGNAVNPVAQMYATTLQHSRNYAIEGTAYAEVDFLKHFTAKTSISLNNDNYYYNNININPYWSGEGHAGLNGASEGAGYSTNYNWTNTINYSQAFGKNHVKAFAGYESSAYTGRYLSASENSFFSLDPAFVAIGNGDAKSILASSGPNQPSSRLSQFGRIDYDFDNKYIIAGTIRRDGSSVFFPGRQYGTFPSVSAAWRISQESFMKGATWLNDLKIRGSYGTSGTTSDVGGGNAYSSFGQSIGGSSYSINGALNSAIAGFYASQYGNTKTTWETDKTGNIGFDATMFNSHFELTAEYYNKKSTGLLFRPTLPATVGSGAPPFINVGDVQNTGLDISAMYHATIGSDFKLNLGANITSYKNKITKLDAQGGTGGNFFTNGVRNGNITYDQVGSPIGEFYGYKVIGYFKDAADVAAHPTQADAAPGRFIYADTNGDGKITDADRTNIGNPNPDFTYGVNINASYKKWDFNMVLYGSYGNKDYNQIKYWTDFYSTLTGNKSNDLLFNSWSPTNLNPKTPKAEATSTFSTDQTINSWYVEKGSFLKCRSLRLGYTFNSNDLKIVGVDRLHIYVQATNLFTITKYTGLDPELQATASNGIGTDIGSYPNNERQIIFGANLSF